MFNFIWPKTGQQVKIRVSIALTLLILSKVNSTDNRIYHWSNRIEIL